MGVVSVIGSLNVDRYVRTPRVPTVGETVVGDDLGRYPGGKGLNQAVAAHRCGATVRFRGAVGADDDGRFLLETLQHAGVDPAGLTQRPEVPTGAATILALPDAANAIVVASGSNAQLAPADVAGACDDADVVLAQLEVPVSAIAAAFGEASAHDVTTILNAAPPSSVTADLLDLTDILVINESEARELESTNASMLSLPAVVVTTLGADGAVWVERNAARYEVPAIPIDAVDSTGAGDAFCGALAAALADGTDPRAALRRACAAGAITASAQGAHVDELGPAAIEELL